MDVRAPATALARPAGHLSPTDHGGDPR